MAFAKLIINGVCGYLCGSGLEAAINDDLKRSLIMLSVAVFLVLIRAILQDNHSEA